MPGTEHAPHLGSRSAAISNAVVHLASEYTGRGPTKAHTYLQDDLVTVVLQDSLTKGERSLALDGEGDLVLSMRRAFQHTMRDELIAAIEQLLGRRVVAFLSANHIDPDIAIESFVLEPQPEPR